jgi:Bacterial SH3 domain
MRMVWIFALTASQLLPAAALASERGQVIRAGDMMAQPFIDAAKVAPVTANQPVTIVARRGGWINVEAQGKNGWVRTLNLRLEAAAGVPGAAPASSGQHGSSVNPLSLLRTNSSGRTVTTGVKGLDEEDIRNATPDPAQLAQLDGLAVADADARSNAERSKLKESQVAYLGKGKGK